MRTQNSRAVGHRSASDPSRRVIYARESSQAPVSPRIHPASRTATGVAIFATSDLRVISGIAPPPIARQRRTIYALRIGRVSRRLVSQRYQARGCACLGIVRLSMGLVALQLPVWIPHGCRRSQSTARRQWRYVAWRSPHQVSPGRRRLICPE